MNSQAIHELKKRLSVSLTKSEYTSFVNMLRPGNLEGLYIDIDTDFRDVFVQQVTEETRVVPNADEDNDASFRKKRTWRNLMHAIRKEYPEAFMRASWQWAVAAPLVLVSIYLVFYFFDDKTLSFKDTVLTTEDYNRFIGEGFFYLADGSTTILNTGTELRIVGTYNELVRDVYLIGEAFFKVAADAHPFRVYAGEVVATALEASFNVKAFAEGRVAVTVAAGEVFVVDTYGNQEVVLSGEQLIVHIPTRQVIKQYNKAEEAFQWKDKFLIFDNVTMGEAAARISDKYHVNFSFRDEALKECRILATFSSGESLEKVLADVMLIMSFEYTRLADGTIVIDGKVCGTSLKKN